MESITELEQKIATLNETGKSARQTIVALEKQMKSLYDGAKRMLEQSDISPASCNVEKLNAQYQALNKQKAELTAAYRSCWKDNRDSDQKLSKLKY